MKNDRLAEPASGDALSIGELARCTGVPPATLRSWETRHGALRPERGAGGHRRYREADVEMVLEIVRQRASGLRLDTAVGRAGTKAAQYETSVFAALCRRHPELRPHLLRKRTLLALSRAVEDECCARAESPLLFAGFQKVRFYRGAQRRWAELGRTAESVVVFADFTEPPDPGRSPLEVPLPGDATLRREWVVVCDAPDYPACLAGWERLDQDSTRRSFETVWTVDPVAVRHAARTCLQLLDAEHPDLAGPLADRLVATPPAASPDLHRAIGLLDRMVAYLEEVTTRPGDRTATVA